MIMDGCDRLFSLQSSPTLPVGASSGTLWLCFLMSVFILHFLSQFHWITWSPVWGVFFIEAL